MGFGNFLKGLVAQINPFDNGRTYGSYNPPKKKKPEDQPTVVPIKKPNPVQVLGVKQQTPTPSTPTNVFDNPNRNLVFNRPQNMVSVTNDYNTQPSQNPAPGTVVSPQQWVSQAPKQSFWNKVRDVVDPNTVADQYRRGLQFNANVPITKTNGQVPLIQNSKPSFWKTAKDTAVGTLSNIPEVGLAAARVGTGIVQGALDLPHAATALAATGTQQLAKHFNNPVTRQLNRGVQDINTGAKNVFSNWVGDAINPLNRGLDTAAKAYQQAVPTATAGANVYRNVQIPLNALAILATLGAGAEGTAGKVGEAGPTTTRVANTVFNKFRALLDKPLTSNEDNVISKTGSSIINRVRPVAETLNTPIKSTRKGVNAVREAINARRVGSAGSETAGAIDNLLTDAQVKDINTTKIPVGKDIPVNSVESPAQNINVRNANTPPPLIQEVSGDAKTATSNAETAQKALNARRVAAAKKADTVVNPDQTVGGVIPGTPEKPFVLTPETVAKNQDKIIQDYATTLKDMGEGNGTQLVPDGNGGYTRTSNNYRTADTAGKNMTKQDWIDEATRQLNAGKAESGVQQAFNDASNPEIQATMAKGPRPDVPQGRPITVKQATGIPVTDQSTIPTGLPETPGKVRITEATAPNNVKSKIVASESAPIPPKEPNFTVKEGQGKTGSLPDTNQSAVDKAMNPTDTFPKANESDQSFLKRQAQNMQDNIQRAADSLKMTKKMTKAERAQRAAAGQKAYEEAKAAGKSIGEQEAARKAAYEGTFGRVEYKGTPILSADEQHLRDMIDTHYQDMPYQAGKVREAFTKLFHAGEPGSWASESGNHIVASDLKAIRRFLNESVPNPDGSGGLGDFAEAAIKDLANQESGVGKLANAIGLQRALRFTADISATGRQALAGAVSHPIEFAKAAKKSFEVMFSHEKYQKLVSELASSKEANYINDRLGAYISVLNDDISKADDIYRNSGWAHKIPGVNKVVAASERQYNTLLSMMRYYGGKRFIDAAGGIGNLEKVASESGNAEGFLKAIGTVTNVNTGRGELGKLGANDSKILSNIFVSPRGLAARIQRFNPKYYVDLWKSNPAAAKEAIRSITIQTALTAGGLAAANKAGLYEDGQIKVGNTRYDITGGAANMIRTVVRVAQFIHGDRKTTPFNNAEDELVKWTRNQLAPFLSSSLDAIGLHQDSKSGDWVNRFGDKITLGSEILNNIAPLNASQVFQDRQLGTSGKQTAINAGLNTLGIGVNTYQTAADKAMPQDKTVQSVYKQLQKDNIGTTTTDINNYVADGNFDAANRAAEYNLMALKSDNTSSSSQIKKAEQMVQKVQLQQQGVPMTDDGITAKLESGQWDTAIKGYQWKIDQAKSDGEISQKTEQGIQDNIKRAEIARDNKFSPELYTAYQNTSVEEWRKMGIPPGDKNYDPAYYNPDMYQQLYNIDLRFTGAGVSLKSGSPDKPRYTVSKSGSGNGSTKQIDTSFGTLKASSYAPKVQQYNTISAQTSSIPHISVQRPNIVHKISVSG